MRTSSNLRERLALQGALVRLRQLEDESRAIWAAFPQLKGAGGNKRWLGGPRRPGPNKGKVFSPEVKKRMSDGMRKYWARRKAAARAANAES